MNGKLLAVSNKVITLIIFVLICFYAESQTTYFVKTDGTAAEEAAVATSWATACSDLQAVINTADSGDQIWVKQGTYKPCRPANNLTTIDSTNRDNSFVLKAGVKIYGSFEGTETTLAERYLNNIDTIDVKTVLSGYSYHVVIAVNIENDGQTILDGFIITGGNATGFSYRLVNGEVVWETRGGGIYNINSSPEYKNIIVWKNISSGGGGGIYNTNSSPKFINVIINENSTYDVGGGIVNTNSSFPLLANITINNNHAKHGGGGICNYYYSSPIIVNVSITNNIAFDPEYLYSVGGGIHTSYFSSSTLTNVTISNNTATNYGGIDSPASLIINNCIICGNGSNIATVSDFDILNYSCSLVEGITIVDANKNLDGSIDPLFVGNGDYSLQSTSPCIDAGSNELYLTARNISDFTNELDLAGNFRLLGERIDMGAYESNILAVPNLLSNNIRLFPNPAG
jgi:hypothetical protein